MNRALKTLIIACVVLFMALVAFLCWRHRDSRGVIVAHSDSPDGRWQIDIYERSPIWPNQSPRLYTFSISPRGTPAAAAVDFTHNNDSAMLDDFRITWASDSATVAWERNLWSVRAETADPPLRWMKILPQGERGAGP